MLRLAIFLFLASCSFGQSQPQISKTKENSKPSDKSRADATQVTAGSEQPPRTQNKEAAEESGQKIDNDMSLPQDPDYAGQIIDCGETAIEPRQGHRRSVLCNKLTADQYSQILVGDTGFWFWGYFVYLDGFDVERTTGFCVKYDKTLKCVASVGLPGYHRSD